MSVTVNFHGILGEIAGRRTESFDRVNTIGLLRKALCEKYQEMTPLHFITSVNGIVEQGEMEIKKGDRIDIIPPMPGG